MNNDFLRRLLEKRKGEDNLRVLSPDHGIDLSSNDYLGFARLPVSGETPGDLPSGSSGSRLLSGNHQAHISTESYLSDYFRSESCLLFGSGYSANLGLLSCVALKDDLILYDTKCHASIKDGMRLSTAKFQRFRHNDCSDLSDRLEKAAGKRCFVVIESVYSMDGTIAQLPQIAEICQRHGALLIVDEAHSTGIYGPEGAGLTVMHGLQDLVFARVHTFGKGIGLHGACVCGDDTLISFLINFSRPFIYTTAPSPFQAAEIRNRCEIVRSSDGLRKQLFSLIDYFRKKIQQQENISFLDSESPIQGILVPGNRPCREMATKLKNQGFSVYPVLSPTVSAGQERIRICLHSHNSKEDIDQLFNNIIDYAL